MQSICNKFNIECTIQSKPYLYNMMISDFKQLSIQYIDNNVNEYSFEMNSYDEYADIDGIN